MSDHDTQEGGSDTIYDPNPPKPEDAPEPSPEGDDLIYDPNPPKPEERKEPEQLGDDTIYDPNPPRAAARAPREGGAAAPPPGATPEAIGGQITEQTFLGYRVTGPQAGLVIANLADDPGLAEAVEDGTVVSAVQKVPPGTDVPDAPQLTALEPNSSEVGADELTVTIRGTGFTPECRVIWNGSHESSGEYVSETEMTVGVDPSTATGAFTVEVHVDNGYGDPSNSLQFSFTEPEEPEE